MNKKWLVVGGWGLAAVSAFAEPTGCPEFTVEKPCAREGVVVKAADFGLSEASEHNSAAIRAALAEAKRLKATRVELAPGTYRFFDEPGIAIDGFNDFTFDGKGAVLVFRRKPDYRGQPQSAVVLNESDLYVERCERVEVKNLTLDWDWEGDPLGAYVRVAAVHPDEAKPEASYVEFDFVDYDRYPKYPEPVPIQKLMAMDSQTRLFRAGWGYMFGLTEGHFGAKNEWVAPNRLRVWPQIPMPNRNQNPATGYKYDPELNLKKVKSFKVGDFFRLQHCYYGKNAVALGGNRHLSITDVTVWSVFGMGMVTDGAQKYWQCERFRVIPPTREEFERAYPGKVYRPRPVTSTSDGHHVARSQGWCKYIDCRWTLNNDDSNNFHDRFTIAIKVGTRKLQIINKRGYDYFRAKPGAVIELREANFAATGYRAKLVGVEGDLLLMDRDLPDQHGPCFLVWDVAYRTDNVLFKGCHMVDSGWRNIFSPSNLTIEDCEFLRTPGFPLRFIADYRANLWCEGMGSTNVVVRNCRFEDNNTYSSFEYGKDVSEISTICVTPDGWEIPPPDKGFVGGDLLIEKCTFVRPCGKVLDLTTGKNVIFRNSTIDLRGIDRRECPLAGKLQTDGAENVKIDNIALIE